MLYRIALIIAASILFGYAAGSFIHPSGTAFGLGGRIGAAVGTLLSPMAALCLRRKPLARAMILWLGPPALAVAIFAPWAPPYVTLAAGFLFAFILCAVIFVQMEDEGTAKPNHCEKCGYDLLGVESGVCPECGTALIPGQSPPAPSTHGSAS